MRWLGGSALLAAWSGALGLAVGTRGPELSRHDRRRPPAVLATVIVPMRNEAANAAACVRGILAQDHPLLQVVVVDDGSSDNTSQVVRDAAGDDPRLTLVTGAALPEGWVGKPWACHQGAQQARGSWLLFVDADVRLDPAAVRLLLVDAAAHDAQVVSWVGRQALGSFWERVVNPVVFFYIAALAPLPLARRPRSRTVVVNGQFLAFTRVAYDRLGGHAAVRDAVVEDLALGRAAKAVFGSGYRFVWARDLSQTRMYRSLSEIREGWTKNVALASGVVGIPPTLTAAGTLIAGVGPWVGAAAWAAGARAAWPAAAAATCQAAAIGVFGRRFSGQSVAWGLGAPLGTTLVAAVTVESWWRAATGRIRWRGRRYDARR